MAEMGLANWRAKMVKGSIEVIEIHFPRRIKRNDCIPNLLAGFA